MARLTLAQLYSEVLPFIPADLASNWLEREEEHAWMMAIGRDRCHPARVSQRLKIMIIIVILRIMLL